MGHIYDIAQLGAAVLRHIAESVNEVHCLATQDLITAMQDTLASTQGVGLAAPQIGISKRAIIVASRPTARYPYAPFMEPTVMLNPRFEVLSDGQEKGWEGCLSIPAIRALVPRHRHIMGHYTNTLGEPISLPLEGFVARVFQHEFDHLDGLVYLDRVDNNRDIVAESEYFKRLAV